MMMRIPAVIGPMFCATLAFQTLSAETASTPAAAPADKPTITLEQVCRDVLLLRKKSPALTAKLDINRDRRIAPLEVVRHLVVEPDWYKNNLSADFAAIDADHDATLSGDEVRAFVDRGHKWKASAAAPPAAPRAKTVRERMGMPAAGGGGSGTSLGGGSAYVFFGHQQAYISDYNVVDGQLDPVISILGYGTVLEVSHVSVTIVRD
jgi:hypothetical protein